MAIVRQQPDNFATNVIKNIFIRVKFDLQLDRTTINDYSVILVETDHPESIVSGRVDYIVGTAEVTFQLFDFLKKNTNYTCILVGGTSGIYKITPHEPFSSTNYVFSFTTGESIDWNIPLATNATYTDGPYFQGEAGIYTEVFGRTGEPVSHIVTTSASIGPSGTIVPAPWGPDRYLPPSGGTYDEDDFEFISSDPVDGSMGVRNTDISFLFNSDLGEIGSVSISACDALGTELETESDITNYDLSISGDEYTITPTGVLTGLRLSTDYTITLTDIKDVISREISSLKITFRTKLAPMYAAVKMIRIGQLGGLITSVSDNEISELIYQNSLWAYQNSVPTFLIGLPSQAAIDYVVCKTKLDLLERMYVKGGAVESKQLADLRIQYGPAIVPLITRLMDKFEVCMNKNMSILITGYAFIRPTSAVKSINDPRNPKWIRLKTNGDFEHKDECTTVLMDSMGFILGEDLI